MDTFFVCRSAMVTYAIVAAVVARSIINVARRADAAAYERHSLEIDIFAYFKGMLWPAGSVSLMETVTVSIGTRVLCALFAAAAWFTRRPVLTAVVPSTEQPVAFEPVAAPVAPVAVVEFVEEPVAAPVAPARKPRKPASSKKPKAAE